MADPLRLSPADRVLIHALSVLSRPGIVSSDRSHFSMIVNMLRDATPMVSRDVRLKPMVELARQFVNYTPVRPGYYGRLHDLAHFELQRWDEQCLAASWDLIKEKLV